MNAQLTYLQACEHKADLHRAARREGPGAEKDAGRANLGKAKRSNPGEPVAALLRWWSRLPSTRASTVTRTVRLG